MIDGCSGLLPFFPMKFFEIFFLFRICLYILYIFRASLIAQLVKNLPEMQEILIQFLGREDPLEKGKAT